METQALEQKLSALQGELKSYFDKAAEEKKSHGTILDETKSAVANLQKQVDAIDAKLVKRAAAAEQKTVTDILKENDSVQRLLKDKRGSAVITLPFDLKTTITSAAISTSGNDAMTTGVLPIERTAGIVAEARRALRIRNVLASRPTSNQILDFVKVENPMADGSPQVENVAKFENAVTFTTASEKVRTLASWIPATRQILDDFSELAGFINTSLPYYVDKEEEDQILFGDATGENLNGLATQATAFDTSLLVASDGWNKIDIIGRALQQVSIADEVESNFVIVNPKDAWDMRLKKDAYGRYLLGDANGTDRALNLFGRPVVESGAMTQGKFLVGNGTAVCAELRDRMGMQVEISTEHSDFFTRNMVAIRAEKRVALVVYRPAAFIYGTLTQSPA